MVNGQDVIFRHDRNLIAEELKAQPLGRTTTFPWPPG